MVNEKNPVQSYHKYLKEKEKKKNIEKRNLQRQCTNLLSMPETLKKELADLQYKSLFKKLDPQEVKKLSSLEATYEQYLINSQREQNESNLKHTLDEDSSSEENSSSEDSDHCSVPIIIQGQPIGDAKSQSADNPSGETLNDSDKGQNLLISDTNSSNPDPPKDHISNPISTNKQLTKKSPARQKRDLNVSNNTCTSGMPLCNKVILKESINFPIITPPINGPKYVFHQPLTMNNPPPPPPPNQHIPVLVDPKYGPKHSTFVPKYEIQNQMGMHSNMNYSMNQSMDKRANVASVIRKVPNFMAPLCNSGNINKIFQEAKEIQDIDKEFMDFMGEINKL